VVSLGSLRLIGDPQFVGDDNIPNEQKICPSGFNHESILRVSFEVVMEG